MTAMTPPSPEARPDNAETSLPAPTTPEPGRAPRRRNRVALSCLQCRQRKIKCNRGEPCASCVRSKITNCSYEEVRKHKSNLWRIVSPSSAAQGLSPHAAKDVREERSFHGVLGGGIQYAQSAAASRAGLGKGRKVGDVPCSTGDLGLAERVRQLEEQLTEAQGRAQGGQQNAVASAANAHGLMAKTNNFGSSHWMNSIRFFPALMRLAERFDKDKTTQLYALAVNSKKLGRSIKARRESASLTSQVDGSMPSQDTAQRLINAYFRTFESVYRILHGPSFWRDFERYWGEAAAASAAFVIQMQLCMAIGTSFEDDVVALKTPTLHWIYKAYSWLFSSSQKSHMNLAGLQVMCLLHLARATCGVEDDLTWISAGTLMRTAMHMGYHRDPENLVKMSPFLVEMRRRMWATILEMVVQSSIDSGEPPLVSLADFDTRPPSNLDDEHLGQDDQTTAPARSTNALTQSTVQLALLRAFPIRLAIAHYVNHFASAGSYEETLRLNSELTSACRALSAAVHVTSDSSGHAEGRIPTFAALLAEQMTHRFFLALHHPWLCSAQKNPAYYFSRKMCVDTSLKLFRASTITPVPDMDDHADDFHRLAVSGAGAFRSVPMQSMIIMAVELLWQSLEERSAVDGGYFNGVAPPHELNQLLQSATAWIEVRFRAGEMNPKGSGVVAALLATIQAVKHGAGEEEVERIVLEAFTEGMRAVWEILKELAGEAATPEEMRVNEVNGDGLGELEVPGLEWGDWDVDFHWDWNWNMLQVPPSQGFNLNVIDPALPA